MLKNKIFWFQLPIILICTALFWVVQAGARGELHSESLREWLFPKLRTFSGRMADFKFQRRGPVPAKNKIVIVAVDNEAIARLGRWPWHRDVMAQVIQKIIDGGAKAVGLDIVFSEDDVRVPEKLQQILKEKNLESLSKSMETDPYLLGPLVEHGDRIVLGWMSTWDCQPRYHVVPALVNTDDDPCPVTSPKILAAFPKEFDKFAVVGLKNPANFEPLRTPLSSILTPLANIHDYNALAQHSGFINVEPDPDGVIRRIPLIKVGGSKSYPSLALEMARTGLGEELELEADEASGVSHLKFSHSGREIFVSTQGVMDINFRGPGGPADQPDAVRTFKYVPVVTLLTENAEAEAQRALASAPADAPASKGQAQPSAAAPAGPSTWLKDTFKDAYVLIGVSALGVFDMRAFPFDSNVPGVEGHATILDNLLSDDMLRPASRGLGYYTVLILMLLGGGLFAYFTQKLEAVPALILFVAVFFGVGAGDIYYLFQRGIQWETSFFYLEVGVLFVFTLAAKYVAEEHNKKFVRTAFSKYVSPAVVDSILKDPTKLTVGGERRDLTILFSDIRGFTTFSEKMDAKQLSSFLNDYLSIMTDIVFDHDGTLDKYIGDAVMAFWGAPLDQPLHAQNACRAAKAMMKALADNRGRFKEQYGVEVDIGIGINSGVVSVGNMGSSRTFEYTVIGDHVNLASRLEGLTKAYGSSILTTRFTFDDIVKEKGEVPAARTLDFVKVKGKKNAVELIQVFEHPYDAEGLRLFEEARRLYSTQKWDEAIALFRSADAKLRPGPDKSDFPCELFIERCEAFKLEGPGADWDGAWKMESK